MKLTTIKIRPQKLERWKMIEGYEDYMVSTLGRVKSLNYNHTGKEKILKPKINNGGYLHVGLYKNDKRKMFNVHRLVANAFIPNPLNKPEVNHIDENKQNNNVKNLEWMTRKENCNHGTRNKRHSEAMKGKHHTEETKKKMSEKKQGENNPMYGKHHSEETKKKMRKPVIGINLKTNEIIELNSAKQGKEYGFSSGAITNCCKNKYAKQGNVYKGYKFYYKEDYEKLQQEQEISLNLLIMDNIKIKM